MGHWLQLMHHPTAVRLSVPPPQPMASRVNRAGSIGIVVRVSVCDGWGAAVVRKYPLRSDVEGNVLGVRRQGVYVDREDGSSQRAATRGPAHLRGKGACVHERSGLQCLYEVYRWQSGPSRPA